MSIFERHQPRQDRRHRNVEQCANSQGGKDANGKIPLRTFGFFAVVETASNPGCKQKTMAAAAPTPANPNGMNGVQFAVSTDELRAMKNTMTASLTSTIPQVALAFFDADNKGCL